MGRWVAYFTSPLCIFFAHSFNQACSTTQIINSLSLKKKIINSLCRSFFFFLAVGWSFPFDTYGWELRCACTGRQAHHTCVQTWSRPDCFVCLMHAHGSKWCTSDSLLRTGARAVPAASVVRDGVYVYCSSVDHIVEVAGLVPRTTQPVRGREIVEC